MNALYLNIVPNDNNSPEKARSFRSRALSYLRRVSQGMTVLHGNIILIARRIFNKGMEIIFENWLWQFKR